MRIPTRFLGTLAAAVALQACIITPAIPAPEGTKVERIGGKFRALAVTSSHACGLEPAGTLMCWGENGAGELGTTTADMSTTDPVKAAAPRLATVAVGYRMTCGLTPDRELFCWGLLADWLAERNGPEPLPLGGDLRFTSIAPGNMYVCGVATDGTAWCWGFDRQGALGRESRSSRALGQVASSERFVQIATGVDDTSDPHTCAVTTSRGVVCWGANGHGETGGEDRTESVGWRDQLPRAVRMPVPVKSVAVGGHQTCALSTEGEAWCWGDNMHGALGVASVPDRCGHFNYGDTRFDVRCARAPVRVDTDKRFTKLAMGRFHTCGLTETGEVWCWGSGRTGTVTEETARRVAVPRLAPKPKAKAARYVALAAGAERTCAATDGDETVCWRYVTRTVGDVADFRDTSAIFLRQAAVVLIFAVLGAWWGSKTGSLGGGLAAGLIVGIIAASLMLAYQALRALGNL